MRRRTKDGASIFKEKMPDRVSGRESLCRVGVRENISPLHPSSCTGNNFQEVPMRRHGKIMCLAILLFPALGLVIMALWNAVVSPVFGLPVIGFFQALGLLLLSRLLFGGWGHWPKRGRLGEHWHSMSRGEKEAFGRRWHTRGEHPWREAGNGRETRNGHAEHSSSESGN
jgi:hypothetical protein